jgi:hypothetical protein
VATGHTMMMPFVDCEVLAARTWLYQPETVARHQLAAVRVCNDGASGLPPGIVTAYEAQAMEASISSAMPSYRCCPGAPSSS